MLVEKCKLTCKLAEITRENSIIHKPKYPYISDHPYIIPIVTGSESRKAIASLNLIDDVSDLERNIFI